MPTAPIPPPPHAFISFRFDDVPGDLGIAGRLAAHLKEDLGPRSVYFAPTDNRLGSDFGNRISEELSASDAVLVLIGPRWENGQTPKNRLLDPDDWVRRELAIALSDRQTELLPILVSRSSSPKSKDLPQEIRRIATTHGLSDFQLDRDYQRVLTYVWASFARHETNIVRVISDDTHVARASVDALVRAAEEQGVLDGERLRRLSQVLTSPPGMTILPLRQLASDYPDIIVLEPDEKTDTWRRRLEGAQDYAREHGLRVVVASSLVTAGDSVGVILSEPSWKQALLARFESRAWPARLPPPLWPWPWLRQALGSSGDREPRADPSRRHMGGHGLHPGGR